MGEEEVRGGPAAAAVGGAEEAATVEGLRGGAVGLANRAAGRYYRVLVPYAFRGEVGGLALLGCDARGGEVRIWHGRGRCAPRTFLCYQGQVLTWTDRDMAVC